ncbi:response regulator [Actinomadura atramentaria]|uniref:response regulator transcription factor n=1 Tax=Actinomadura atramentaria TaxID=1990 RepID=UPI00037262C9|nr:response regulator transcription factor [Actinomadura atramentaria]
MSPLRVVVADDNPVVRSGLAALLELHDVAVVGEAGDGRRAIELAARLRPDAVLLDVRMPVLDGVAAAGRISAHAPVLMLTYTDDPAVVRAAIRGGAGGYLVHGSFTSDELVAAVRAVAAGERNPLSPQAARALVAAVRDAPAAPTADRSRYGLSARETEVMDLIARGLANREIAARLFLTEKTVKNHVNRIFTKLAAANRAAAIARWLGTEGTEERRR